MERNAKGYHLGILCFLCLVEAPVLASGLLDEMFFTSEWWAEDAQRGEIELFTLGFPAQKQTGNSYHFAVRQATGNGDVFALSGNLGLDEVFLLNATAKLGNPDLYYGFGGMIFTAGKQFLFFPRLNLGGKFGPDFVKLVLDADFYTLIVVNGGKLELGVEVFLLPYLRVYGGMLKVFFGNLVVSEFAPTSTYQLAARYDTKPFFVGGELYFSDQLGPYVVGEAGVNYSALSFCGR